MRITEWFARAVAAGLMPDDEDISGRIVFTEGKRTIMLFNESKEIYRVEELWNSNSTVIGNDTQLRKDGKDLFGLEWRKPTEGDVGKMCWFYSNRNHKDKTVYCAELFEFQNEFNVMGTKFIYHLAGEYARPEKYCLLADHNQVAPTEADFKRIYGVKP